MKLISRDFFLVDMGLRYILFVLKFNFEVVKFSNYFFFFFDLYRPPCIPYVGLVLQDLTFVHIGNPDTFDGKVNFAKRWQQFNILVRRRIFSTKCSIV